MMGSKSFYFKHFILEQDKCAMKVGTDSMLLGCLMDTGAPTHILDIGSGTGVIALMLAQRCNAQVDAIELVPEAAEQARGNAANSRWAHSIKVYNCAIQQYEPGDKKYELIVSNPPYFAPHQSATMKPDRLRARASAALDFNSLITESRRLLANNGVFTVIIPYTERWNFIALCEEKGLYPYREIAISSYAFASPVRSILHFSFNRDLPLQQKEFCIYDAKRKYTPEYIECTKEFHARDLSLA